MLRKCISKQNLLELIKKFSVTLITYQKSNAIFHERMCVILVFLKIYVCNIFNGIYINCYLVF